MIKNPFDAPEAVAARKNQEDPLVLYLVVRESLNMSPGKLGAQVGHAVGMVYQAYFEYKKNQQYPDLVEWFEAWSAQSYRKIVLKADEKEWQKLKELDCFVVIDAGLTELAPSTETVMSFFPILKSQASKLIKRLQVL